MSCQVTQQLKGQSYFGLNMKRLQASQDKKERKKKPKYKLERVLRQAAALIREWPLAV